MNRWELALESYATGARGQAGFRRAKLAACMADLPVLYRNDDEVSTQRAAYEHSLRALRKRSNAAASITRRYGRIVPAVLPGLSGSERPRSTGDLRRHGLPPMAKRYPPLPPPAPPTGRIRVGIVTGYFWRHSVWKIPVKGWVEQLDRNRFEVFGYHTGSIQDEETRHRGAPVRSFRPGTDAGRALARDHRRRRAACAALSRYRDGPDVGRARRAAPRAGAMHVARPSRHQRLPDRRLFPQQRPDGARRRRRSLHREAGAAAQYQRLL